MDPLLDPPIWLPDGGVLFPRRTPPIPEQGNAPREKPPARFLNGGVSVKVVRKNEKKSLRNANRNECSQCSQGGSLLRGQEMGKTRDHIDDFEQWLAAGRWRLAVGGWWRLVVGSCWW